MQRGLGHDLAQQWRAQSGLAQLHDGSAHGSVPGHNGAYAYSTLAVALRHRVDEDCVVVDALEIHGAEVGRACVHILAVHLVAEEVEVIFLHQVAQLHELLLGIYRAGGVVGVAYHDGPCLGRDELLKLLDARQAETVFDLGGDGAHHAAHTLGKGHIVGIHRLGDDHLVARVQCRQEGEENGLAAACGDDDVVGRDVDVVLGVVVHQLFTIASKALRGRVLEHCACHVLERVEPLLRAGQVGLTDVEMVHLYPALLGSACQGSQLADG